MKILFISLMLVFTMWSEALGLTYSNTTSNYSIYYEVVKTDKDNQKLVYVLCDPTGDQERVELLMAFVPVGNFCYVYYMKRGNNEVEKVNKIETLNDHLQFLLLKNLLDK